MATYTVVVTDQVFPDVAIETDVLRGIDAEVVSPKSASGILPPQAATADALLNTYLPLDRAAIGSLERCRVIARYGIGVDNIDLQAAREAGIVVTNVPDYSVEEVAVHAITLMLALVRRLPRAMARAAEGQWGIGALRPIPRLSELTVGVVGLGKIGTRVVALLRPMGCRVVGFDPYVREGEGVEIVVRLDDLLGAVDVVSLHLPATPETRGMIDATALARMRPGTLLINTSRGALVHTSDLADALRSGHLGGAALDVLEREAADASAFEGIDNVILTPHMAYYSESSLRESQRKAATQVLKVLTGQAPDYPVT